MDDSTGRPLTRREWRRLHAEAAQQADATPADDTAPRAGETPPAAEAPATAPDAPESSVPHDAPRDAPTGGDFSLATMFASSGADKEPQQPTILTVCTGNICRSPLAATLLATRLSDLDIRVASAGTQALVGHGMPEPAQRIALAAGADPVLVSDHEARLLTEQRLGADLVLGMTAEHRTFAVHLAPSGLRRTFALREFARLARTLSDEELQRAAAAAGSDPRTRLTAVVTTVADRRGTAPATGDEDIVDPYRQPFSVYEESAAQLVPALDEVERVVRIAIG
ncbi:protein-tyrosine phosphatase [Microbacterium resistens]|uniref:Protein-tyrosine phosphatase n=1 Tax=Microbacterium resistens TaxID=156977 RepID=A0ABU1SCC4_9MICO|nr:hypothetical protein [Microbacterium resistens]MDR6867265.1 protein-tyrosine phosphatase [Microbacterium resistens]